MNNNLKRLFLEIILYILFNFTAATILHIGLTIVAQALLLILIVGIARKVYPDK